MPRRDPGPRLKILVLAGGPDRERPVSLLSGQAVADALVEAGHEVQMRDVGPEDLTALDAFSRWGGDVVFPVLHGRWGEGGSLQRALDLRGLPYVGSAAAASELCMDKHRTKELLDAHDLPTPAFELLGPRDIRTIDPPVVLKPIDEGSSIDLLICHDKEQLRTARQHLGQHYQRILLEQFIEGKELTVGVLGPRDPAHDPEDLVPLPPIRIIPATPFYDYAAKYDRDDTQYLLDRTSIGLGDQVLADVQRLALEAHRLCGCRHLSRVDFIVDDRGRPWILEINTVPGFTTHSLVPKAAAHIGLPMPQLVDRLVRMAVASVATSCQLVEHTSNSPQTAGGELAAPTGSSMGSTRLRV